MVKESTAGAEEERGEETSVERGWESMGKEGKRKEGKKGEAQQGDQRTPSLGPIESS
jgi:hypothetical protein